MDCFNNVDTNCEFCVEIKAKELSRFNEIYIKKLNTRVVDYENDFLAMPTLGQIIEGSMLILPQYHVETMADVPYNKLPDLLALIQRVSSRISELGNVVCFEHGARCQASHSCGIYHAHIHMIPVPDKLGVNDVFLGEYRYVKTLAVALSQLSSSKGYFLMVDANGEVAYLPSADAPSSMLNSQWFRKFLATRYRCSSAWDWREYTSQEESLIRTVNMFAPCEEPVSNMV
jgi:diadenosine tetraphosphate (Ap4A) HIT family hydrolase